MKQYTLLIFVLIFLLRLPLSTNPRVIDDERVYATVAIEMLEGGKPYEAAVERKPPLLFYIYKSILKIGGKYNAYFLHAISFLWTLMTLWGLFLIAKRLFNIETGLIAVALYGLYEPWLFFKNLAFNGEMMMNMPIIWGVFLAFFPNKSRVRWELVLSGSLFCCAFLIKQPAAVAAIPIGLYLLSPAYRNQYGFSFQQSFLHAFLLTVGFFGTLSMMALFLYYEGILETTFFWTIQHHGTSAHGFFSEVYLKQGLGMFSLFSVVCFPIVLGAIYSMKNQKFWQKKQAEYWAVGGLIGCSIIAISSTYRFTPHYFIQLILPLSLAAAPFFYALFKNQLKSKKWFLTPRFHTAFLAMTFLGFSISHWVGINPYRSDSETGKYLYEYSDPSDRIFVWGLSAHVYLDAERRPASRFILDFPLTGRVYGSPLKWDPKHDTSDRIVPNAWETLAEDFKTNPPEYIVDTDVVRAIPKYPISGFSYLNELLKSEYHLVKKVKDGWIYRRNFDSGNQVFQN